MPHKDRPDPPEDLLLKTKTGLKVSKAIKKWTTAMLIKKPSALKTTKPFSELEPKIEFQKCPLQGEKWP